MTSYLYVFLVGVTFSFLGSIAPGTLNLCVLQLGLEKKIKAALRFALAVTIIEYPYAWIAVQFETWITSDLMVMKHFKLMGAAVMMIIGTLMLYSVRKPTRTVGRFSESGFRRGLVLSILNPMIVPFWMGVTAYLKSQGWLQLSSAGLVHSFLLGTSVGVFLLLSLFMYLSSFFALIVHQRSYIKYMPGVVLLLLGSYAFIIEMVPKLLLVIAT